MKIQILAAWLTFVCLASKVLCTSIYLPPPPPPQVFDLSSDVISGNSYEERVRKHPAQVLYSESEIPVPKAPKDDSLRKPVTGSGITWNAEYLMKLNEDEDKADFEGWITIDNNSGKKYINAVLNLTGKDYTVK